MAKRDWILSDPLISNTSTDLQSPYHNHPSVEKSMPSLSRSPEKGQFWLHSHDLCDPSPWLWSAKTSMMWIVELTFCMGASPERPFSAKDQNKLEAKPVFSSSSNIGTEFIKRAQSLLYWRLQFEVVMDVVVGEKLHFEAFFHHSPIVCFDIRGHIATLHKKEQSQREHACDNDSSYDESCCAVFNDFDPIQVQESPNISDAKFWVIFTALCVRPLN